MTVSPVSSAVGTPNIPASVRALSSLPDIDYADRFTLTTEVAATPQQWARAMFGDVPNLAELLIWRGLLGLRLSRERSPATVAGWRIGGSGDDWIRLEAASRFLTGTIVVEAGERQVVQAAERQVVEAAGRQVSVATLLRYDRAPAHAVWALLSPVHRRLVPVLLRGAETRLATGSPPTERVAP
jgi:hypothetical protein